MLAATSAGCDQQATAASIAVSGAGMARKKRRVRRGATTFGMDEELIAHLGEDAPEVLQSKVSEAEFEGTLDRLLKEWPTVEIKHFYCRPCGSVT
jgi:hypothetical protein